MPRTGLYGVVNVVLHPHFDGAYRKLFMRAAKEAEPVKYFGDRYAKLSPISQSRSGVFAGKIATWLEINTGGNVIQKETLDEMLFSDSDIKLPEDIGFNARVFTFAFRESDHRLFIELINDHNEKISISAVQKILQFILEQAVQGDEEVVTHVVASKTSVAYVLSTPQLRKLEIEVHLPNPDILTAKRDEAIATMEKMQLKKLRLELTRKAGAGELLLTPGTQNFAELAAENGSVKSYGKEVNGSSVERSTRDQPKEIEIELQNDESRAVGSRRAASTG
jgi:hypothetical protein